MCHGGIQPHAERHEPGAEKVMHVHSFENMASFGHDEHGVSFHK